MVFDLRNVPSVVVNLPSDTHRRDYMTNLFTKLGMPHSFVPGITRFGKKKNVAAAYAGGFDSIEKSPFIIFDDDQELLWQDCVLPHVPDDADIIYLATRNSGCLPDKPEYKSQFGLNAYDGLALAESYDDTYFRLYSMISSMAILICSERGKNRYRLELRKAFNRSTAADIRYAFAMPDLNVYALRTPMFAENQSLQVAAKSDEGRRAMTHTPLREVTENEIRIARHRHRKMAVKAVRDEVTKALNWEVLQAVQPTEVLSAIEQTPVKLPGYNRDVLKDRLEIIQNAKVFPPHTETGSCGVTDEIGRFCKLSAEYRWIKRRMPAPETSRHEHGFKELKGTYVYGGWMHPHFGHFLAESIVRLWALGEDHGPIDGIVFIPYGPKTIWRTRKAYLPMLRIFTGDLPIIPQVNQAIVERLIVAEPGFGHQSRMAGSPKFIDFFRRQVATKIAPQGPERLYVSRSNLNPKRGGVFGEKLLEEFLISEGYEVFHPQQHSAEEQLARYAAARYLISLDGSPLHFAAFALQPGAKVGIIKRRYSSIPEQMVTHINRFSGADVSLFDHIEEMWVNEKSRRVDYSSMGRLDLVAITKGLKQKGFTAQDGLMAPLSIDQINQELAARPDEAGRLVPYEKP